MASAPQDGTRVLGWFPDLGVVAIEWTAPPGYAPHWNMGRWLPLFDPTHWMPPPEGPLPFPMDTAPRDGTTVLGEFDGIGMLVVRWSAPAACAPHWNHGRWLPGLDPVRWDNLPDAPV